ncbi:Plant organelle RNA recognition domain-containing protein [Cinnamomum micranthum f. kanehirae]|uniref:Plant organelle RNA recognition domain-containing protein n=1 Tax=Cinnamomum micranthum f. kanehirae TaxID=337451 RepID=A0A443PI35_9MAGN|nr:Plant organelle RNA recognition domain-containing protein [Cinnamomum micranthum f. kanehirae]
MATGISSSATVLKNPTKILNPLFFFIFFRPKTTSAQYVSSRALDPTLEKLMRRHKNLLKVVSVQDLILASPDHSIPLPLLSRLSQKLHLNRGAASFLRRYPHIFSFSPSSCRLTPAASLISRVESSAASSSLPSAVDRLLRLLSISPSRSLPLRAVFKVWRELGLPDDFEDSVISQNPSLFALHDAPHEPNTHILKLVRNPNPNFTPAVDNWRQRARQSGESCRLEEAEIRFGFKQEFPPGMKLSKDFRARLKEWQRLRYVGPYEKMGELRRSKAGMKALEKRAVGIVHEFLSLTVEKMVEVEKISHFRKWFGIELNIRDLFLDHPGIFYLSTKGKRHTIFLREAYERGCLIEPNPIYDARRKLLELVILGRRGLKLGGREERRVEGTEEEEEDDDDDDDEEEDDDDNDELPEENVH